MSKRKNVTADFHNAAVDKAYELGRQDAFREVTANQWFADQVAASRTARAYGCTTEASDPMQAYETMLANEKAKPESLRASALDEAKGLITGDRNNNYGPPHQDFQRSADALTAIMGDKLAKGERFHAHEIAQIVILIKLSRLQWTPTKRDSWVDIAGYAGCGFEAAVLTTDPEHVG